MQIFTAIALILGAIGLLLAALLRVLHDLLERGPFDAPSIDDGLAWPPRTQSSGADARPANESSRGVNASDLQTP
jgi:hypothetical protein